jgi:hypothetical protein
MVHQELRCGRRANVIAAQIDTMPLWAVGKTTRLCGKSTPWIGLLLRGHEAGLLSVRAHNALIYCTSRCPSALCFIVRNCSCRPSPLRDCVIQCLPGCCLCEPPARMNAPSTPLSPSSGGVAPPPPAFAYNRLGTLHCNLCIACTMQRRYGTRLRCCRGYGYTKDQEKGRRTTELLRHGPNYVVYRSGRLCRGYAYGNPMVGLDVGCRDEMPCIGPKSVYIPSLITEPAPNVHRGQE